MDIISKSFWCLSNNKTTWKINKIGILKTQLKNTKHNAKFNWLFRELCKDLIQLNGNQINTERGLLGKVSPEKTGESERETGSHAWTIFKKRDMPGECRQIMLLSWLFVFP